MKLLFIDSTIREPECSRTYQLCKAYLESRKAADPALIVEHLKLTEENLKPYLAEDIEKRDELLKSGTDHEMFRYARQFAGADAVLIGAPYWDCSFPAVLKIYLEHICVNGITFFYTENGPSKICRAEKVTYITSCGGFLGGCDLGADYVRGLSQTLLAIPGFAEVTAEGLDMVGADVEAIMKEALDRVKAEAKN